MPHTQENAERRVGAIAALRELLRQGLDVESQCQIEDWSTFLNQALNKLMAAEIVELLTWDSLANTRKNKKSLESQNQRVVVDANCLYTVMMAHIALGFSSKQIEMVYSFWKPGTFFIYFKLTYLKKKYISHICSLKSFHFIL